MERFVEADGRADLMNIREKQEQTEMELLSPYAIQKEEKSLRWNVR